MTTEDLYVDGEERFGRITSFLFGLGSRLLDKYYSAIVNDLRGKKFDQLLDIGCGNGELLSRLAREFPGAKFYGLDPSQHMLDRARKNLSKKGLLQRVELRSGSSRVIPFEYKFDAVISSFSYHHWKGRDDSLSVIASHLSDKGFISIYEHDNTGKRFASSHGIDEREWNGLEIKGLRKSIEHKGGLIILTLAK